MRPSVPHATIHVKKKEAYQGRHSLTPERRSDPIQLFNNKGPMLATHMPDNLAANNLGFSKLRPTLTRLPYPPQLACGEG